MLHTLPLTLNTEFRRAYYRGRAFPTSVVVVYILKNRKGINRLGLTATKKVGKAVARNRARRIMKEGYRLTEAELPVGYDYVLVARGQTPGVHTDDIVRALRHVVFKMRQKA